ncbi:MAG: ABC transporter permease [Tenuifilaceae bacterium]
MFLNNIKIALRFLFRNLSFSFIKIVGLAIGMACFVLIYLWVKDEISYDKFHANYDGLYRVVHDKQEKDGVKKHARTCLTLSPTLKEKYPEVKFSSRYWNISFEFGYKNKLFSGNGAYVDPDFFNMFSFPLIYGDKDHVMDDKMIVVVTEEFANKIFGKTDVVGEALTVDGSIAIKITGVIKNSPKNSHLQFDFLLNLSVLHDFGFPKVMWDNFNNSMYTYIYVEDNKTAYALNDKIKTIITENAPDIKTSVYLQPLSEVYLYSDFLGEYSKLGDIQNVYIFSSLAFLILIIACFNFMNLSIAQSTSRAKEVGMRKVSGASRMKIIWQFILESVLIAFFAHILAMLIVELVLPIFNYLFEKSLEVNYFSSEFFLMIFSIIIVTGIVSGSYPAFYLSNLKPIKVLKENTGSLKTNNILRQALVVLQFTIAISLIIVTGTMILQLRYMKNKDIGFNKESVISVPISGLREKFVPLKEQLIQSGKFKSITVCSHELTDVTHYINADWEGKDPNSEIAFNLMWVDKDYIKTMQMEIAQGSDFQEYSPKDSTYTFILNETAVKQIGYSDPIGKKFILSKGTKFEKAGIIIGVVKDFHFKPLKNKIEAMALSIFPNERYVMYIRLENGDMTETIKFIESKWNEFANGIPFQYKFLDDSIQELYISESKLSDLMEYTTIIGILISCLGLFGLAAFMTERRTKEVGIRKAIGATNSSIVYLFTIQMVKWVIVAIVISWPLSWYISNNWLQNFSYRVSTNYWLFIFSALIAISVAILSVIGKSLAKAKLDPAKALRYE